MATITNVPYPPISCSLSDLSRFRRPAPVTPVGSLTPFLAPSVAEDPTLEVRVSDRDQQAMHRLRHPFASL
ncbi:hypothetical protein Q0Z83_041030 [Actinoplanes sichuanensis]|nr:hypothetical protein Q0Z83_041030 [Actinoplanes sichuanensis]